MFDVEKYKDDIGAFCEKYMVNNLTLFGSALSGEFNESSDIDFLLELDGSDDGIKRYMNLKFDLADLLSRLGDAKGDQKL